MAQLTYTQDYTQQSTWLVRSDHPGALAAVPDAIVQTLGLGNDHLTCWALHPTEQDGYRHDAYLDERGELGLGAAVDVVEVLRPRQQNVVWVDRYHLIATNAPAATATRVLGLYTGGKGSVLLYVHDPSVGGTFAQYVTNVPHAGHIGWNAPHMAAQSRFGVYATDRAPMQIELVCAPAFAPQVQQALQQLAALTASW
jgi:hypothetical protein